jgi:hypothetical protein
MDNSLRSTIANIRTRTEAGEAVGDEVASEILARLNAANLAIVHKSDLEILIEAAKFRRSRIGGQLLTQQMELALFLGLRLIESGRSTSASEESSAVEGGRDVAAEMRTHLELVD